MNIRNQFEKEPLKPFSLYDTAYIERTGSTDGSFKGKRELWIIVEELGNGEYKLKPSIEDKTMHREENIVDLYKMNPEGPNKDLSKLMFDCNDLYYKYTLTDVFIEKQTGIHEWYLYRLYQLLDDIEKQQEHIPYSQSLQFFKKAFNEIKAEFFNLRKKEEINNHLLNELYPQGLQCDFKQGKIGTCYLLASLKALKQHPQLMKLIIEKSIKKKGKNTWTVEFLGDENNVGPIEITDDKIAEWKKKSGITASLGDIILELAYGSYSSRSEGNKNKTMFEDDEGKISAEGGYAHRTLADILGPLGQKFLLVPKNERNERNERTKYEFRTFEKANDHGSIPGFFLNKYPHIKSNIVLTASSEHSIHGDTAYQWIEDNQIWKSHAYSIVGFDPYTQSILISNPHNSETTFSLSFHGFNKGFRDLKFNKIDNLAKFTLEIENIQNTEIYRKMLNEKLFSSNIYGLTNSINNDGTLNNKDLLINLITNYNSIKDQEKKEVFRQETNRHIFANNIPLNLSDLVLKVYNYDLHEYQNEIHLNNFRIDLQNNLNNINIYKLTNSYYSEDPNEYNNIMNSLHYYLKQIEENIKNPQIRNIFNTEINNFLWKHFNFTI